MTHQILLNGLRQGYFKLDFIKVLIFDECHHARGNHPYACIMTVSYFSPLQSTSFIKFLFCCIIMIYLWFIITLVEVIFVFSGKSFWKSPPPCFMRNEPCSIRVSSIFFVVHGVKICVDLVEEIGKGVRFEKNNLNFCRFFHGWKLILDWWISAIRLNTCRHF